MIVELKEMIEIKKIVQDKARYQKVLLLYDESVSNGEIKDIYELIREDCIYNQMQVDFIDENEIMNGYRIIIYYMSANSFNKLNFHRNEFINIMLTKDNQILPFLLDEKKKINFNNDYFYFDNKVNFSLITSVYFNRIYRYLQSVIYNLNESIDIDKIEIQNLSYNFLTILSKQNVELSFLDLMILCKTNLSFEYLSLLDYVLLVSLEIFLLSIRNKTLTMVDVFKLAENDSEKINKFYEMMNNTALLEVLNLNFNFAINLIRDAKNSILELVEVFDLDNDIKIVMDSLKNFACQDNELLGYMFFYNIL